MPVECRNAQRRVRLATANFKRTAQMLLNALGQEGKTLSVLLVDDETMRLLHKRWMGSLRTTDVLSFPQSPTASGVPQLLGDVVISVETAARRTPKNVDKQVRHYLIHGMLHLAGFGHDNPKSRCEMRRETRRLISHVRGRCNG